MGAVIVACTFVAIWFACLCLHRLVTGNNSNEGSSLQVSLFFARLHTSTLNGFFVYSGRLRLFPYRVWFGAGVLISLALMIASCLLLAVLAYNTLAQRPASEQVLTPVVPGVNLPGNQLPYYLGALLLCGIFHEFGHAVAAAREDIRIQAAGVFILGVYPGAFVDLNSADLALVSPARRLRVFCAGVWHNTVLALAAAALLAKPAWLLTPLGYASPGGAVVTWLAAGSVLSGQQGLYPGDVIVRLNQCPVAGPPGYYNCVMGIFSAEPQGHCIRRGLLLPAAAASAGSCCQQFDNASADPEAASRLCFLAEATSAAACLPARAVVEQQPACRGATDCPPGAVCARPVVDNASRLVRFSHDPARPALLYLGEAPDIIYSLTLSEFQPPALLPLWLPAALDTGMRYIVSLSGALALLNAAPCYALDGQWILAALLDILIVNNCRLRQKVYRAALTIGTCLLALNVLLALRYLYYSY